MTMVVCVMENNDFLSCNEPFKENTVINHELHKASPNHSINDHSTNDDFNLKKFKMLSEYEQQIGKRDNKRHLSRVPLWYFLHELLGVECYHHLIDWEDKMNLVFTIKDTNQIAVLWGKIKNRKTMTYAKLARGIRYYYGKGVIEKHYGKRFTYKFIVSKKTKAVLLKHGNHLLETLQVPASFQKRQNKTTKQRTASRGKPRLKRHNSTSSDGFSHSSTEHSSDEEEGMNDFVSAEDMDFLDNYLAGVFNEVPFLKLGSNIPLTETTEASETYSIRDEPCDLYHDCSTYNSDISTLITLEPPIPFNNTPLLSTLEEVKALLSVPLQTVHADPIKSQKRKKMDKTSDHLSKMEEERSNMIHSTDELKLPEFSSFSTHFTNFEELEVVQNIDPFLMAF